MNLMESFKSKITDDNSSCLRTLEKLVQKLVNPGEDFDLPPDETLLKVDDFKKIF